MSKFIQGTGKWFVSDEGSVNQHDDAPHLYIYARPEDIKGSWYVAAVADIYNKESKVQENARLIAAAPEMYEELCEALEFFKKESFYSDEAKTYVKSIEELLARIDGEEINAEM